jgi:hypothetical protein
MPFVKYFCLFDFLVPILIRFRLNKKVFHEYLKMVNGITFVVLSHKEMAQDFQAVQLNLRQEKTVEAIRRRIFWC